MTYASWPRVFIFWPHPTRGVVVAGYAYSSTYGSAGSAFSNLGVDLATGHDLPRRPESSG